MTCPCPFIAQPRKKDKKYTLVLDMDETLIHSNFRDENRSPKKNCAGGEGYQILYRPYCR